MKNSKVYIFTEGGKEIGLGHLTRCIALYDELEERDLSPMMIILGESSLQAILNSRRVEFNRWHENWQKYLNHGSGLTVNCIIDSYIADKDTYYGIRDLCNNALYIDDTNRIIYPRGITVNPSMYVSQMPYHKQEEQVYLAGIDYVIVRKEFQNGYQRVAKEKIENVLIILGGSDVKNLMSRIIKVLGKGEYDKFIKHVVVGNEIENINKIEELSRNLTNIKLHYSVDASQLFSIMQKCDFAITAAGQTIHELIAMQLPFACIKIIDNQGNNIKGLLHYHIIHDYLDCSTSSMDAELEKFIDRSLAEYQAKNVRDNTIADMKKLDVGKGVRHIIDAFTNDYGI